MLTRRDFLRGLIASVASAALVKNGVAQPEQVIGVDWAEGADRSVATVFDMAANTWRGTTVHQWASSDGWGFAFDPPLKFDSSFHLEVSPVFVSGDIRACCVYDSVLSDEMTHKIAGAMASLEESEWLKPQIERVQTYRDAVAKRIQSFCQAIWEDDLAWRHRQQMPTGIIRLDDGIPT